MRALAPAWPPKDWQSSTTTRRPSDAAYTAVARPAGPGADHGDIQRSRRTSADRASRWPRPIAASEGLTSTDPLGQTTTMSSGHRAYCMWIVSADFILGDVDDVMRVAVTLEKVAEPQDVGMTGGTDQHRARRRRIRRDRCAAGSMREGCGRRRPPPRRATPAIAPAGRAALRRRSRHGRRRASAGPTAEPLPPGTARVPG